MASSETGPRRSFQIGRYHCTETLAVSPLGETFRAKVYGVAGLEKQYALKQVDAALRVDPDARRRLVEAARRYATLEHDRIARLSEINDEGDTLFFVVELQRGIDLPRLLAHLRGRGETLPVEQAILIAVDVAEALEAAARPTEAAPEGVLHLGLHPSTISILGEGEVRLADFALASALERPGWAEDDTYVPFLAYHAPELLRGAAHAQTADVWGVGAVLFELCTGAPLLGGATATEIAAARQGPIAWDKLPSRPRLREVLEPLLSDDPASRPQTASVLRDALAGLLGLELTRARAGLQALVKRALGRTLTRTGSFAAVAIPSASFQTLPPEPAPASAAASDKTAAPAAKARGWAPPRATGTIPVVVDETPKNVTLPGLGAATRPGDGDPPQMELAELPPSSSGEVTVTERTIDAIGFDDGVTSPHDKFGATPRADPAEGDSLELDLDAPDGPTTPGAGAPMFPRPGPPPVPGPVVASLSQIPPDSSSSPTLVAASPGDPEEAITDEKQPLPVREPSPEPVAPPPVAHTPPLMSMSATPLPAPLPVATGPIDVSLAALPTAQRLDALPAAEPPARANGVGQAPPPPRRGGGWVAVAIAALGIAAGGAIFVQRSGRLRTTYAPAPPVLAEAPKPAAPEVEAPKLEAPKVEAPKPEAPKVEAPKPEAPKVEAPKPPPPQAAKVEAPKAEAPKVEAPKPAPAVAGQLAVQTTPPGAAIWLDGELRGPSPLTTPATVGKHRVIVVLPGMKLVQRSVAVEDAGGTLTLELEAAKLPIELRGDGGLKVRCQTQGELRILVDGHDTGMSCPNAERISVEPGPHTIGLQSPRTGEIHELSGEINEDPDHSTRIYTRF